MKTTKQILSVGMAILTIFIALYLVFGIAAPALSATLSAFVAAAGTPTPPPGDEIPLKPIEDLTSLNATINLDVNGLINGERAQGDLTALLTTNDQGETQITVTGSLLGDIAAQVGGSIVGLFTPSKVDIYKVPEGTYIVVNGLFPLCIKPKSTKATAALEELSPQSLLSMVTSSDVARGEFIGEGKLNGKSVKHYVLNGDAFLAAAQKNAIQNCAPSANHCGMPKMLIFMSTRRAAIRLLFAAATAALTNHSSLRATSKCRSN